MNSSHSLKLAKKEREMGYSVVTHLFIANTTVDVTAQQR